MPGYLRFTRDDCQAITRAAGPLPLTGSYSSFRRALADALRQAHPALAERVAGLPVGQVRVLREYLAGRRAPRGRRPGPSAGAAVCDLSFQEWRAVAEACALIWLHDDSLPPVKGFLVRQVGEASPALAQKLARLSNGQFVRLCLALRAGRRCCP